MKALFRSLIVVMTAGLLLLTGCASLPQASIGVEVGDQIVRADEIDDVIATIGKGTEFGIPTAQIMQIFVASAMAQQYAADHDITIDEADVQAARGSDEVFVVLADDPVASGFERRLIVVALVGRQIPNPDVLAEYEVLINPRYPVTWNVAESSLVTGSTSLSSDHRS